MPYRFLEKKSLGSPARNVLWIVNDGFRVYRGGFWLIGPLVYWGFEGVVRRGQGAQCLGLGDQVFFCNRKLVKFSWEVKKE